jgi:hypothetical protein
MFATSPLIASNEQRGPILARSAFLSSSSRYLLAGSGKPGAGRPMDGLGGRSALPSKTVLKREPRPVLAIEGKSSASLGDTVSVVEESPMQ